jgi:hypothetical protein
VAVQAAIYGPQAYFERHPNASLRAFWTIKKAGLFSSSRNRFYIAQSLKMPEIVGSRRAKIIQRESISWRNPQARLSEVVQVVLSASAFRLGQIGANIAKFLRAADQRLLAPL